jgi:ribonuclease HI
LRGIMPWIVKHLRGAKVWAECNTAGALAEGPDARVDVLYKKAGKRYRAAARNLEPADDTTVYPDSELSPQAPAPPAATSAGASASATGTKSALPPLELHPHTGHASLEGAVHVYTDGACTGNPGPMGIGVVLLDPLADPTANQTRRELSEFLGFGTNNIAELTAILRGLQLCPRNRPVVIYSDSAYAIGLLSQSWKAKANAELVAELRQLVRVFPTVRFVKVAGHAGVPENERCDELARNAVTLGVAATPS